MDQDSQAGRDFYQQVLAYSEAAQPWLSDVIYYETTPDEEFDLSLISYRVYGRREEYLTVMAVAGISSIDQPVKQQRYAFPSEERLLSIKRQAGFESIAEMRDNGAPVWGR